MSNHNFADPDSVSDNKARRAWIAVLARAPVERLEASWRALDDKPDYSMLRPPESGLVMVRGRAGGTGQRFNLGEMTVTRCVVTDAEGRMGCGYVAGRDHRRAELAACFDALMQDERRRMALERDLIAPLAADQAARRSTRSAEVATSKVDFFTMVRGDSK